ncbi:MAG: hypothetical protein NTW68_05110 [candidate division NC10 bacterium]|nr:hypothetical protein [candidate division NC10 bacterium]
MRWILCLLSAALLQAAPATAASPPLEAGQIFWKNPGAPETAICRAMVIRSAEPESPSGVPFCRAFRQFQVLAVQDGWAQLGTDVWIRIVDLTNPYLLQPFDPRPARAVRPTEIGSPAAFPNIKHAFSPTHSILPVAHEPSP